MAAIARITVEPAPPADLQSTPILLWSKEDHLKYPLYIMHRMKNWSASTHTNRSAGLIVSTTPLPDLSIRITDLAGQVLFEHKE